MCSSKVIAVDKEESDEEDDSFELVEHENHLTPEQLWAEFTKINRETEQFLNGRERKRRTMHRYILFFLVLLSGYNAYYAVRHLTIPIPSSSTAPPTTSSPSEGPTECPAPPPPSSCPPVVECPSPPPERICPPVPECPKNCNSRRWIRFEYRNDENGLHIPIPFAFGFQDGFVTEVELNSNAHLAGLEVGDQLLSVNGVNLEDKGDRLIFDSICHFNNNVTLLEHLHRRITGYRPEHCAGMARYSLHKDLSIEVRKNVADFVQAQKLRSFLVGCAATIVLALFIRMHVKKFNSDSSRAKSIKSRTECVEKIAKVDKKSAPEKSVGCEQNEKDIEDKEKEETGKQDIDDDLRAILLKTLKAEEDRLLAMRLAREEERKTRRCEETARENNAYSWENGPWPKGN